MKRISHTGTLSLILILIMAACVPFFEGNVEFSGQLSFGNAPDRDMIDATATALAPILRTPIPSFTPAPTQDFPTRQPLPTLPPDDTEEPSNNASIPNIQMTATALANLLMATPTVHSQNGDAPDSTNSAIQIVEVINPGNLSGEGIRIRNTGEAILLDDWCIHDEDGNLYTFGQQLFATNAELTIFTHDGIDTPVFLYWGLSAPIWEAGEIISLRDEGGNLVATSVVR